jgi:hypothetical protein
MEWAINWLKYGRFAVTMGVRSGHRPFQARRKSTTRHSVEHALTYWHRPLSEPLEILPRYFRQSWEGPYKRAASGAHHPSELDPATAESTQSGLDVQSNPASRLQVRRVRPLLKHAHSGALSCWNHKLCLHNERHLFKQSWHKSFWKVLKPQTLLPITRRTFSSSLDRTVPGKFCDITEQSACHVANDPWLWPQRLQSKRWCWC